jgi:putative intracellular protease/amidase
MSPAFNHEHKVLFVLTSHDTLGDSGKPTGYTVSEAADPWKVFKDAGWDVHVATVAGGPAPEDGFDPKDATQVAWKADPHIQRQIKNAPVAAHVNAAIYDAVYLVGGHGTMWDFPSDKGLANLICEAWERDAIVSAVCHGPAALTTARTSQGELIIVGRKVTGFSNAEEKAVKADKVVPFLLEDKLVELGGEYSKASHKWREHVVVDGRLITGQNPASAGAVAKAVVEAVG